VRRERDRRMEGVVSFNTKNDTKDVNWGEEGKER